MAGSWHSCVDEAAAQGSWSSACRRPSPRRTWLSRTSRTGAGRTSRTSTSSLSERPRLARGRALKIVRKPLGSVLLGRLYLLLCVALATGTVAYGRPGKSCGKSRAEGTFLTGLGFLRGLARSPKTPRGHGSSLHTQAEGAGALFFRTVATLR